MLIELPYPAAPWGGLRTLTWKAGANSRNARNHRLPYLTVTACVGVWSDNYPDMPHQRDCQRQTDDKLNQAHADPGSVTRDCMGSEPIGDS
jgi:hypothetical protein